MPGYFALTIDSICQWKASGWVSSWSCAD